MRGRSDVIGAFGIVTFALLLAPVSARRGEQRAVVNGHSSGPGRAISQLCESVCMSLCPDNDFRMKLEPEMFYRTYTACKAAEIIPGSDGMERGRFK